MYRQLAIATAVLLAIGATAVAQQEGLKRSVLQKTDFPANYQTLSVQVDIAPNFDVPRHTHPGIEVGYVLAGEGDLMVQGQAPRHLKAGDSFLIPAGTPHSAKAGPAGQKIVSIYVVEQGKPLATPAP